MILALRTGWTPDVIGGDAPGGVTDAFRRAAHGALYTERLAPLLEEAATVAATKPTPGLAPSAAAALGSLKVAASKKAEELRGLLYPGQDDDDG